MSVNQSSSRYKYTPKMTINGVTTYSRWIEPSFLSSTSYTLYAVTNDKAGRPDQISTEVYGTPDLYWAIIAFNAPEDVLNWPPTGSTIKIPSASDVLAEQ